MTVLTYVRFFYPGLMYNESTERYLGAKSTSVALQLAHQEASKLGIDPFAFQFITKCRTSISESIIGTSEMHYLGGEIFTLNELKKAGPDPELDVVVSNMERNGLFLTIKIQGKYFPFVLGKDVQFHWKSTLVRNPSLSSTKVKGASSRASRGKELRRAKAKVLKVAKLWYSQNGHLPQLGLAGELKSAIEDLNSMYKKKN